jgi:hypothetical protein
MTLDQAVTYSLALQEATYPRRGLHFKIWENYTSDVWAVKEAQNLKISFLRSLTLQPLKVSDSFFAVM